MDEKQKALLLAFAEMERDTPGTITGMTVTKDGQRVTSEDPDGLVAEIREALSENEQEKRPENGH